MKSDSKIVLVVFATLAFVSMVVGCDNGGAHRDVVPNVATAKPVAQGSCVPFVTVSKAIFEPKCKSCHGDGSPNKNWLDHGIASQFANNILDKVSNTPPKMGGATMPMGGKLSADEIALLKSWIDGGAQKVCASEPVKVPGDVPGSVSSNSPVNEPVSAPAPTTIADTCIGCHGANGGGVSEDFPNLAGLSVAYIEKQLRDFRSGDRVDAMMNGFAKDFKDGEITKLAEYFNKMKPVDPSIVTTGNAPADVAVCTSCHGSGGMANATAMPGVPNLAGQKATYIVKQLKSFKTQNRKDATMSAFAGSLSDSQIEMIAKYFSGLKPAIPPTSQVLNPLYDPAP